MSKKCINEYKINEKLDLERIIDDFTPYIRTIINNIVGNNLNNEDKEEIILDSFFILWKNYSENKEIYSLDSYIAGITRNLIKEKLRTVSYSYNIDDYENMIIMHEDELYEEREEAYKLEKIIKKLKDIDIKIVKMFYYSSKSIKDIASELKTSELNVKVRLYRVRKKIRKDLVKESKK